MRPRSTSARYGIETFASGATSGQRAALFLGALVIIGSENHGGRWLQGTDRQLRATLLSPFVRQRLGTLISTDTSEDLELLRAMIHDGRLTPALDRTYPLDQAADAIRHLREGTVRGKFALTL